MSSSARRIQRLRLSAPDQVSLGRARTRLEDAFRTASLPGLHPGAAVFVRHLDLGRWPAGLSSTALARHLEARVGALPGGAVQVAGEDHPQALAVWFADELEALLQLAVLLARGRIPRAWYWPLAVPGWRASMDTREGLRAVLGLAATLPGGDSATARVVDGLLAVSGGAALLWECLAAEATMPVDPTGAATSAPVQPASGVASLDTAVGARLLASLPLYWRACLADWLRRHGPASPRLAWLVRLAVCWRQPALAASHGEAAAAVLLAAARAVLLASPADTGSHGAAPGALPADMPRPPRTPSPAAGFPTVDDTPGESAPGGTAPSPDVMPGPGSGAGPAVAARTAAAGSSQTPAATSATGTDSVATAPWIHCLDQPSAFAGLVLVVKLLEYLAIRDTLATHPELAAANLPQRILQAVADRLGIPGTDPIRGFMDAEVAPTAGLTFTPPPAWARTFPLRRVLTAPTVEGVYMLAMGRFLRRHAGLGLRTLVCRPGRVALTRSHLDVRFAARLMDIRLRRSGLDLDPGWTPWLGRVVCLHYDFTRDRAAP